MTKGKGKKGKAKKPKVKKQVGKLVRVSPAVWANLDRLARRLFDEVPVAFHSVGVHRPAKSIAVDFLISIAADRPWLEDIIDDSELIFSRKVRTEGGL